MEHTEITELLRRALEPYKSKPEYRNLNVIFSNNFTATWTVRFEDLFGNMAAYEVLRHRPNEKFEWREGYEDGEGILFGWAPTEDFNPEDIKNFIRIVPKIRKNKIRSAVENIYQDSADKEEAMENIRRSMVNATLGEKRFAKKTLDELCKKPYRFRLAGDYGKSRDLSDPLGYYRAHYPELRRRELQLEDVSLYNILCRKGLISRIPK